MITCAFYFDKILLSQLQWKQENISQCIVKSIKRKMKEYATKTGYPVSTTICNGDTLKFVVVDVYLSSTDTHFISYIRH